MYVFVDGIYPSYSTDISAFVVDLLIKCILMFTGRYFRPWSPAFVLNRMCNSLLLSGVCDWAEPE